ncbi:hypothetical protein [Paenibacillus caseinilyticus]|nr:hypothetical protein [Paenibacillus caseinilyticus]MCZ8518503.1 hypothetical protein [Paenibacillus caseinilyticus]
MMLIPLLLLEISTTAAQPETQPKVQYPCSVVLLPVMDMPNTQGAALITKVKKPYTADPISPLRERQSVGIYADWMPDPSSFGDYDQYEGLVQIPGAISWRFKLSAVYTKTSGFFGGQLWAGKTEEISMDLPVNTRVEVRLFNSKTKETGRAIAQNTLQGCK